MKKIPDVFVIVTLLIILACIATWLIPGGSYSRQEELVAGEPRLVVVPGTYAPEPAQPQLLEAFMAPLKGFKRLASIIGFIFIVGGAFHLLSASGAIAAGIGQVVKRLRHRAYLIIPLVMGLFSLFGALFGMCEEAMPFVLIFVPLALALGYDSIVGVCLSFLAAGVGFAGAFINPFTVQIGQSLAAVEPLSGMGYRVIVWLIATAVVITWVMLYARRIARDPTRSPMYALDQVRRAELAAAQEAATHFTWRHAIVLVALATTIVVMILGSVLWDWYLYEIAGLFLGLGLSAGLAAGLDANRMARAFVDGCKEMTAAALIIGFAGGIVVILEDGRIMDSLLHGMASVTFQLPPYGAASLQYLLQIGLNFFVPSGTTQAALTMPIMAPLAELSGLTRQTAVLIFQFGDGFTNMIIPTSGITVGTLAMARIPFSVWFRWCWPLQVLLFVLVHLFLIYPVLTGWS